MTTLNVNTKAQDKLLDAKHLSRELQLIYDSVRDISDLANHDGLRLDSFSVILQVILQKMANTFNEIESDLLMYSFSSLIREASTDEEKIRLINEYQTSSDSLPRRVYE